jgi:hypothetical protein
LTKLQSREILNLLLSLNEFELYPLVTYIQEILIKDHLLSKIFLKLFQKSFLLNYGISVLIICYNFDYLFKSTKFLSLNPAILEIILNRDDVSIDDELPFEKFY